MRIRVFFILLALLLVSWIQHLYRLDQIPPGIDNDETSKAYDAYSLVKTGRDQWGDLLPIYFKGFGDYRAELYTYIAVSSIALLGLSVFAVRLPAVLFSLGSILGTFLLGKSLFNQKAGLASAFFVAFAPWFFGMTRVGIEAPLGTFFMIYTTLFFIWGVKKKKWLIFSALFFSLTLYSYHAHRVIVPLYIVFLFMLYYPRLKPFTKVHFLSLAFFLLLITPLSFAFFRNQGQVRIRQLIFTQDIGVVNRINEQRGACQKELSLTLCTLTHNKFVDFSLVLLQNYLAHFSFQTLFLTGLDSTLFVTPPVGLFLLGELPLFLIGAYHLIKNKRKESILSIAWLLLGPLPDSFTGQGHYHRFFIIFPAYQLISGLGLSQVKNKYHFVHIGIILLILLGIFQLSGKYFGSYRFLYSRRSHYEYIPLFHKLLEVENQYKAIYLSRMEYDTKQYIFYLFFKKIDPMTFQNGVGVEKEEEAGGWVHVRRIGKWYFVDSLPNPADVPEGSLVVGGAEEFKSRGFKNVEKTYHLDGTEAFYIVKKCTKDEIEAHRLREKLYLEGLINIIEPLECY